MCSAMEILGMHCWHSLLLLSTNHGDIEMWDELVDRKFGGPDRKGTGPPVGRSDFDQILHGFGAISSDTPAIAFAKELIEAYPEAKVVLVEREIESWYQSFTTTVIPLWVSHIFTSSRSLR
jgi:hypothetical protein